MSAIRIRKNLAQAFCCLAMALLLLMWLNPFAPGPSPAVAPLLICFFCSATLLVGCSMDGRLLRALGGGALVFIVLTLVSGQGALAGQDVVPLAGCIASICVAGLWVNGQGGMYRDAMCRAWLTAALFSSALGLLQYFNLALPLTPWVNVSQVGEAFANLRQRNQFASLTNIGFLALLCMVAQGRIRIFAFPFACLLAVGNAASASRTGALQLIVVTALIWFWSPPQRSRLLRLGMAAVVTYLISAQLLPWLLELLTGGAGNNVFSRMATEGGCSSRTVLWSNVLELIGQKPWLGWGWNELDYAHYIHLYQGPRFCDLLDNAHNLPLHLAVELGIPGAIFLCGGFAWMVCRAKPWRENEPLRQMAWGIIVVIMLHSMLEYPLWYGPFQISLGLSLGLVLKTSPACIETVDADHDIAWEIAVQDNCLFFGQVILAMLMMIVLMFAASNYHRVSQMYLPPPQRSSAYRENTMEKVRGVLLYRNQARFAELGVTALTSRNAAGVHAMASELLHFSPEPMVIEKTIESATMLGLDEEALGHMARYRAAFPEEYARWVAQKHRLPCPAIDANCSKIHKTP